MNVESQEIIALDPAPKQTAWVQYKTGNPGAITAAGIHVNEDLANTLLSKARSAQTTKMHLICEGLACYGMPVGQEVFETAYWIGEYRRIWRPNAWVLILRTEVKMALCRNTRARDSNIRQALIDIFGPPGTKKNKGLTYGFKADMWAALAVAVAFERRSTQTGIL